jgi:aspartyl-tRNA synthetase
MRERIYIKDLKEKVGQNVTVFGFVHNLRVQSKIIFLILRDVTGTVQVVSEISKPGVFEICKNLSHESVVSISGKLVDTPQAPGGVEIKIEAIEILSYANPELPIPVLQKGGEETEAPIRLDYRWLDLRRPEKLKIFRVWTELEKGFRKFFQENNFIQIYPPALMSTASESGAEVFEVNYFDRKAYLAQSPQFYKQMAMAAGFEKVFMVGPVFRAEASFTTRHVTEFTGWDFEVSYIESHHDLMDIQEKIIQSGFEQVVAVFPEINLKVPTSPFPRITMKEAKEILKKLEVASPEEYDLSPEEERAIAEYIQKEKQHDFVFITDYHKSKSAFYHKRVEDGSDYYCRADLLFRGLEVVTLAQREPRLEVLEKQALEKGMNLEPLKDYLNFFRYGCPPHGGAGIGPGRLIMKILDLLNVREATYLPRDVKRLNP